MAKVLNSKEALQLFEIAKRNNFALPGVNVVGTNSLFIYMLASLASGAIRERFVIHAPDVWFAGRTAPVIEQVGVMAVLWLLCFWLYRQRAFLRL